MKRNRQPPLTPEQQRLHRLLDPGVSLERAYAEIHAEWFRGRAADSTVEALMFSLRSGVSALAHPDTLRRLSDLDDAQLRDVVVRLQKFSSEIAPPWTLEDMVVLLAARDRVRG
jgi:hypothetical protein